MINVDKSPDNDRTQDNSEKNSADGNKDREDVPLANGNFTTNNKNMERFVKNNHLYANAGITDLMKAPEWENSDHAFKHWQANDESQFSILFNLDSRYFCLGYYFNNEMVQNFQQHLYEYFYPGLFYIFIAQQAKSMTYPGISWMELNNLISLCNIFTPDWTEAEIDRIYEECIQSIK